VFVRVRHEIADGEGLAIIDQHDIVYRGNPRPGERAPPPSPAPVEHAFSREIDPGPVLLFRYSALTFNSHRIHYDRSYVTSVEGYPGLVVHGPLIATLLLDLLRRERPHATIASFAFRAVSPLFDGAPFAVCGKPGDDPRSIRLWAKNPDGGLAMDGTATLA
jgi:3-methylfumaryl-CoA hydratase